MYAFTFTATKTIYVKKKINNIDAHMFKTSEAQTTQVILTSIFRQKLNN